MEFLTDCDGGRESPAEFSGELRSVWWWKRCRLHFAIWFDGATSLLYWLSFVVSGFVSGYEDIIAL